MKQRSTITQLISYLDKICAASDTTNDCLTVFLDVKKLVTQFRTGYYHINYPHLVLTTIS